MLRVSLSPASLRLTASSAHRSACTPWTPTKSSPSRASAARTALRHGRPTAPNSFSLRPCTATPNSSSPTPTAAHPSASPFANGANTSPAWNPKTGNTIVFVSDRGGVPQLYMMNSDGTSATELDLARHRLCHRSRVGAQRRNPRLQLAPARPATTTFMSWKPPHVKIVEITRDSGRNERPSWAPDGRHIVFESTRSGSRQIWTMLADGSQAAPTHHHRPQRIAQLVPPLIVLLRANCARCITYRDTRYFRNPSADATMFSSRGTNTGI